MQFFDVISNWINRHFSDAEAVYLVAAIAVCLVLLLTLGNYLAPVLTGLIFAFLLQGIVERLVRWRVPKIVAIIFVMLVFLGVLVATMVLILPMVWQQIGQSTASLPNLVTTIEALLGELSARYPTLFSEENMQSLIQSTTTALQEAARATVREMVVQVPNIVGIMIYVSLVPISMFFFMKDHRQLLDWFKSMLPKQRPALDRVGAEMSVQITKYVRGKALEILIVGTVTYIVFKLLGLNYAESLSLLIGLSVLIPLVGAVVVTIPVIAVALLQHGWSIDFIYVLAAYTTIQVLDGNFLIPVLFSEVVDLHPIFIIIAVLTFGGIWGIWGVFFAIPLATLVRALFNAWPSEEPAENNAPACS